MRPLFKQIEIFSGILTVYFNYKYFSLMHARATRVPPLGFRLLGWVVQSRVKITRGYCKISIQIRKVKTQIQFYSFCPQFDDLLL